ncbi:hypothetical protein [Persephonella hydrogeniphila]|uniref:hypothetical protein n=1 Tax=Persephonella hydrogeniphila TaxID=198703 RepID=UPI000BE3F536|nr:hypothetical protein [Persephonella hydrogeniphila]
MRKLIASVLIAGSFSATYAAQQVNLCKKIYISCKGEGVFRSGRRWNSMLSRDRTGNKSL